MTPDDDFALDALDLDRVIAEMVAEPEKTGDFSDAEFRRLSQHFEAQDEHRADRIVGAALESGFQRDREIDRLETLRDTDFDEYSRRGGSDRILQLLRSE